MSLLRQKRSQGELTRGQRNEEEMGRPLVTILGRQGESWWIRWLCAHNFWY